MSESVRPERDWATEVFVEEEWRNAQTMAKVRAGGWFSIGVVAMAIDLTYFGRPNPASLAALTWGVLSAALARFVFRRSRPEHGDAVRMLLVSVDLTVLAFCFDASQEFLGRTLQGNHSLFGMAVAVAVLIVTNVLNASFRPMLWSVAYGTFLYLLVLRRHGALDFMAILDVGLLLALTAAFYYSSRNLQRGIRSAAERQALARFLPASVVERVANDPRALCLGGVDQEVTILFADIRGFTSLSERMEPSEVVGLLNEYFAEMVEEIFRFGGTLDKFIGDGICAVFRPPLPEAQQARNAVLCALAMLERMQHLNRRRSEVGLPALEIGVGLHTGRVIAGNIGSPKRLEYTHIGDAVNTASRVESMTKVLQVPLLVTAQTLERAGGVDAFVVRRFDPVQVKGKAQPLELYSVTGTAA